MSNPGKSLALSDFEPAVGEDLEIIDESTGAAVAALKLTNASALPLTNPEGREPFSLFLEGPANEVLSQGTYMFRHSALGDLPIFVVPIAQNADTRSYQAIFN